MINFTERFEFLTLTKNINQTVTMNHYVRFSPEKLRNLLAERKMRERDLIIELFGPDTRRTFKETFEVNFQISRLVTLANVLSTPIDTFFEFENECEDNQIIIGNNSDISRTNEKLKMQIELQNQLLEEKDRRIEDLQKSFEKLSVLAGIKKEA